jgi:hypothetical protein
MGKNTKGGNHKHMKNKRPPRELVYRSPGQFYAQVVGNNGNGRLSIKLIKDEYLIDTQAIVRGSCRRCRFEKLDIILVAVRDFTKEAEYDVCVKYSPDHATQLVHNGEIPNILSGSNSDGIVFVKQTDDDLYNQTGDDINYDDMNNEDLKNKEHGDDTTVDDNLTEQIIQSTLSDESDSSDEDDISSSREIKGSIQKKIDQIAAKGKSSKVAKAKINAQREAKNAELEYDFSSI